MNTISQQGVDLLDGALPTRVACALFGLATSSFYYQPVPASEHKTRGGGLQPHALTPDETRLILDTLTNEKYRNTSPRQAYSQLLDEGTYLASPRTFARILQAHDLSTDRSPMRLKKPRPKPVLAAYQPNDIWNWDTSPLLTMIKGTFFHLYVIMDMFSRFAIDWTVEHVESSAIAENRFTQAITKYGINPATLTVHSDNGPIQRSHLITDSFHEMKITKSHSRPHVSNDNPYSESLFKTAKYQVQYPWTFTTIEQAKNWADEFFHHYNYDHYHSGIAMLTPASLYMGTAPEILDKRQQTLNEFYAIKPERFKNQPPTIPRPQPAWINKPNHPTQNQENQKQA